MTFSNLINRSWPVKAWTYAVLIALFLIGPHSIARADEIIVFYSNNRERALSPSGYLDISRTPGD